jgi:cytochrome c peroxidase
MLKQHFLAASLAVLLAGCGGGSGSSSSPQSPATPATLSEAGQLGELIFNDVTLSASGRQSCASCHDPARAHGPSNNLSAQLGGANGDVQGFRASPSLRYLNQNPAFFFANDGTPTGGFDRDGRANSLAQQGERPFLAPHEMANADVPSVVAKLAKAAYVERFRRQFGAAIIDNPEQAFSRMTFALQAFQREAPEFHPFDSKYDYFLAGKVKLSDQEMRGLALFNNPAKGNCIACHGSVRGADGSAPLFTDFTFDNLGVPRNVKLQATKDPAYFDLGLCGPDRTDLADTHPELCGAFKVPTLRNVATRQAFFHNGVFDNLKDVVSFYVRRDTNPEEWYPIGADGTVQKFNDLPPQYRKNVNTTEGPYNRQPGMQPALTPSEIDDVVKFLGTLTDGYKINP